MLGENAHVRRHRAGVATALACGYVASVLLSVLVSRAADAATLWTANGFLAGAFILLPRAWRIGVAAVCVFVQGAIVLMAGDGPVRAVLYPLVNLLEAGLAGWLAIRFAGVRARRLSLRELALLPVVAIAPAALASGAVGALIDLALRGRALHDGWLAWTLPSGLGMAIVLPALLLAVRPSQYKAFHRSATETGAILAGVGALVAVVFLQDDLPLQFAIFPALTLVALRLGPPGAAAAGLLAAIVALPLTMLGHGPAARSAMLDASGRARISELVIAAALFTTLVTALAVADQTRLRALMLGRDRAARSALRRARMAESAAAEAMTRPVRPRERAADLV
jgi:integral membrane sensor domain MASE1